MPLIYVGMFDGRAVRFTGSLKGGFRAGRIPGE